MAVETNKPNFQYVWASGGAKVAPSDVKIQNGWTAEVPPFQWENWSQNRQDEAILHLFQKGISEWDAASNYYFTTSGPRSYVQGSDGTIYVALQDSVGQNPTTATAYWQKAFVTGTFLNQQIFTSSGTYTPTPGMKTCRIRAVGGGGGGAGLNTTNASQYNVTGGASGGGYSEGWLTATDIGPNKTVTIGAGGAAGAIGTSGGNGGTTSLGSLIIVPGGIGSSAVAPYATNTQAIFLGALPGGVPTGGSILNLRGESGSYGLAITSSSNQGLLGGNGGSSLMGPTTGAVSTSGLVTAGMLYGSGASGGVNVNSQPGAVGAAGAAGILIIEEYA